MEFSRKWLKDPDWRHLLILLPAISLFIYISLSVSPLNLTTNPFSSLSPLQSFFSPSTRSPLLGGTECSSSRKQKKICELNRSRIAICLVGGARRFELTGPSIVQNVINVYPNADVFLHAPLDEDSYKFSFLKVVARMASVRIFKPEHINETESQVRVLTKENSPNGYQGLLQYFNLVEGCLTMINSYQTENSITYDWVVRTRVDGYWNAPLDPANFKPGQYIVPSGSNYGGLNDRLGIGDLNSTTVALSRLSLIPELESAGFTQLNSESAFRAQLTTQGVTYLTKRLPFCIVSDRRYDFPPVRMGVPVASIRSPGPLSGVKCRPCKPICVGSCVTGVMEQLYKWWSWTNWENGSLELCDAHDVWATGWQKIYDRVAGKKFASVRKRLGSLKLNECVAFFEIMKKQTVNWDTPPLEEICSLGLGPK